MEFVSKLREIQISYEAGIRIFERIKAGQYDVSIQAGSSNYSCPRTLTNKEKYSKWEIAIFESGDWLYGQTLLDIIKDFSRKKEIEECYGGDSVGSYVPTDLIEDLLDYLGGETTSRIRIN